MKYRRKVIDDAISNRGKEIFLYIADNYGITLEEWNHDLDHVHIMFRAQPKTELSKLWKEAFWSQSFCLLTAGGAPIETVRQYIESQGERR